MNLLLTILFVLLMVATALLYRQLQQHKAMLAAANDQLIALAGKPSQNREPEMVITLRVIDPIALAKRESRSARAIADRLPVMVRKMVYQQLLRELELELQERQIDAEMMIEYR